MSMARWASWWRTLWGSGATSTAGRGGKALGHLLLHLTAAHALLFVYMFYRLVPALRQPKGRHGYWVQAPTPTRWALVFLTATDLAGRLALLSLAVLLYGLALYLFGKPPPPPWHEQLNNISTACMLTLAIVWWTWALYAAGERLGWTLASWNGVAGGRPPRGIRFLQQWRAIMGALTCSLLAVFILLTILALCGVSFVPQPGSQAQSWLLCSLAGAYVSWLILLALTRMLE